MIAAVTLEEPPLSRKGWTVGDLKPSASAVKSANKPRKAEVIPIGKMRHLPREAFDSDVDWEIHKIQAAIDSGLQLAMSDDEFDSEEQPALNTGGETRAKDDRVALDNWLASATPYGYTSRIPTRKKLDPDLDYVKIGGKSYPAPQRMRKVRVAYTDEKGKRRFRYTLHKDPPGSGFHGQTVRLRGQDWRDLGPEHIGGFVFINQWSGGEYADPDAVRKHRAKQVESDSVRRKYGKTRPPLVHQMVRHAPTVMELLRNPSGESVIWGEPWPSGIVDPEAGAANAKMNHRAAEYMNNRRASDRGYTRPEDVYGKADLLDTADELISPPWEPTKEEKRRQLAARVNAEVPRDPEPRRARDEQLGTQLKYITRDGFDWSNPRHTAYWEEAAREQSAVSKPVSGEYIPKEEIFRGVVPLAGGAGVMLPGGGADSCVLESARHTREERNLQRLATKVLEHTYSRTQLVSLGENGAVFEFLKSGGFYSLDLESEQDLEVLKHLMKRNNEEHEALRLAYLKARALQGGVNVPNWGVFEPEPEETAVRRMCYGDIAQPRDKTWLQWQMSWMSSSHSRNGFRKMNEIAIIYEQTEAMWRAEGMRLEKIAAEAEAIRRIGRKGRLSTRHCLYRDRPNLERELRDHRRIAQRMRSRMLLRQHELEYTKTQMEKLREKRATLVEAEVDALYRIGGGWRQSSKRSWAVWNWRHSQKKRKARRLVTAVGEFGKSLFRSKGMGEPKDPGPISFEIGRKVEPVEGSQNSGPQRVNNTAEASNDAKFSQPVLAIDNEVRPKEIVQEATDQLKLILPGDSEYIVPVDYRYAGESVHRLRAAQRLAKRRAKRAA